MGIHACKLSVLFLAMKHIYNNILEYSEHFLLKTSKVPTIEYVADQTSGYMRTYCVVFQEPRKDDKTGRESRPGTVLLR